MKLFPRIPQEISPDFHLSRSDHVPILEPVTVVRGIEDANWLKLVRVHS